VRAHSNSLWLGWVRLCSEGSRSPTRSVPQLAFHNSHSKHTHQAFLGMLGGSDGVDDSRANVGQEAEKVIDFLARIGSVRVARRFRGSTSQSVSCSSSHHTMLVVCVHPSGAWSFFLVCCTMFSIA
jgi:hypothetical protein